ncbi:hypothetical protein [Priestia endophytica]|nr:hypothetical protein [Priestia endophytica]MCM3538453.1 hypothetical protein [Priestia endophytica]
MSLQEFLKATFITVPAFYFAVGLVIHVCLEEIENFKKWKRRGASK